MVVKKSNKRPQDSIVMPAVRKDFWEFLISRHPSEESYAPSTRQPFRWRAIPGLRLVVGQFLTTNGVGVYVRGEKDASPDEVEHRLRPYEGKLRKSLGTDRFFIAREEKKYFFQKFKICRSSSPDNWAKMADWLHKEANAYEQTLRQILT